MSKKGGKNKESVVASFLSLFAMLSRFVDRQPFRGPKGTRPERKTRPTHTRSVLFGLFCGFITGLQSNRYGTARRDLSSLSPQKPQSIKKEFFRSACGRRGRLVVDQVRADDTPKTNEKSVLGLTSYVSYAVVALQTRCTSS